MREIRFAFCGLPGNIGHTEEQHHADNEGSVKYKIIGARAHSKLAVIFDNGKPTNCPKGARWEEAADGGWDLVITVPK